MDKLIVALLVISLIAFFIYFVSIIIKSELEIRRIREEIDKNQKSLDKLSVALDWIDENREVLVEYINTNYTQEEISSIDSDEFLSIIEQLMNIE